MIIIILFGRYNIFMMMFVLRIVYEKLCIGKLYFIGLLKSMILRYL